MPQAIPAVIAAISYVGSAATAVVAGTATLAQIATVAAVGIGAGAGSMTLAKSLTPQIASQGAAVQWHADPDEPLRFAFGRVGVKGSIKDAAIYGPDRMYVSFACTVSAAGPIRSFVSFRAGDYYMAFNGAGMATTEPYAGEMWLSTRLGTQPDTALSLPSGLKNGAAFPGWGADRKMSGSAGYLVTLGENSKRSAYDGKIPAFVATIEGLYCYDPRLDSTYPGGAGSCRLNDPTTWVWTQNPILFALKWTLGLWEGPTGKGAPQVDYQVGGIGAKVDGVHLASFVAAANISDANGWTSAGYPSTDDDKAQVLDGFMKAGGARYAEIAGQIACIHRAAPRATVFTVTARDTAGPVEIDTASSKLNRINTIRPRFFSESHEWEMTALPEVTATEWQIEDGQGVAVKRTRGADYTFVDQAKQGRELGSLEISHSREGIRGRVPLRPYIDPEPGNCFEFDEPDFALANVKCFVLNVEDDTENDTVIVTFEAETDGKYPFAYGQTASPPPAQELDPFDPRYVTPPDALDWEVVIRPPAPDGGGQIPGFDLTGVVSNATAARVLVETGPTDDGPWTQAYDGPPTAERIQILVDANTTYFIAVSYFNRAGNQSARTVYGPFTTGEVIGGQLTPTARDQLITDLRDQLSDTAAAERLAETLIQTILDEQESYELEAERRLDADTGVLNEATVRSEAGIAEAMNLVYTRAETDEGLASTLQVARAYTDTYKSEAELLFSTKVERANGDAIAVLQAKAYTDDLESRASLTYVTQASFGSGLASTLSAAQSYTNGQISTALATTYTRAQIDGALATTVQQAQAYTDALRSDASLIYATTSAVGGVSATASLALSTAVTANGAANSIVGIAQDVNGYASGFRSINNGTTSSFDILTDAFRLLAPAGGARSELIGGVTYAYPPDNAVRYMSGKPFAGDFGLVMWTGPNSVPIGSETKSNAWVYVSMNTVAGGRFGGSDVPGGTTPLMAMVDDPDAYGSDYSGTITTETINVSVAGTGAGSATIRWVRTGGDEIAPTAPSAFSTQFTGEIAPGQTKRAVFLGVVVSGTQAAPPVVITATLASTA